MRRKPLVVVYLCVVAVVPLCVGVCAALAWRVAWLVRVCRTHGVGRRVWRSAGHGVCWRARMWDLLYACVLLLVCVCVALLGWCCGVQPNVRGGQMCPAQPWRVRPGIPRPPTLIKKKRPPRRASCVRVC